MPGFCSALSFILFVFFLFSFSLCHKWASPLVLFSWEHCMIPVIWLLSSALTGGETTEKHCGKQTQTKAGRGQPSQVSHFMCFSHVLFFLQSLQEIKACFHKYLHFEPIFIFPLSSGYWNHTDFKPPWFSGEGCQHTPTLIIYGFWLLSFSEKRLMEYDSCFISLKKKKSVCNIIIKLCILSCCIYQPDSSKEIGNCQMISSSR